MATMRALFVILLMLMISGCSSLPKPITQSPDLTTNTATIVASREGAYFLVVMDIAEEFASNPYAVIQYQELNNPQKYKALELGGIGESKRLTFKSRPDKKVHADTPYSVLISLYDNPNYSNVIAQRSVVIMPNIPTKIADLMDIQWL